MSEIVIGVDLGGTRLRAARFDGELTMQAREEVLTQSEQGPDAVITRMKTLIRNLLPQDGSRVAGIGISAPGPANPRTGVVVAPPNLFGWHHIPIVDIMQQEFGIKTYLGNDANVAVLAEVALGAARGCRDAIFMTISTGIGGGVVSDGRLLLGKDGLGAEVGHMIMLVEDRVSTLEKEAAGPALARQARERLAMGERSIISDMVSGDLSQINGSTVGHAAAQGDAMAVSIVRRAGRIVGLGFATLLHLFNPEILVLGGGVSQIGELLFEPMREAIREGCIDASYWRDLRIEQAALGENVSLYGAAALVVTHGGVENVIAAADKLDGE